MSYQTGVGQRTAVVTGAAAPRGIGYATARRYAQEGWAVALLDIDQNGITTANQRLCEEFNVPSIGLAVDVTDRDSIQRSVTDIAQAGLPPVGAVANIAGMASPVPFLDVDLALWHKVLDVNLTGTFLMCQAFLPQMIDHGYGRIVNMSSVSAQQGGGVFGKTPYSSAKAAVLGFTRSLARELGPTGITVNAIAAGAVDTDIRVAGTTLELEASIVAGVPLGRQATVDDVTALFAFLASEEAGYITATTQNLNGGSYIA
jgi:2-hydroxycyclohexanecarboxyl-CoA dehydrogenase